MKNWQTKNLFLTSTGVLFGDVDINGILKRKGFKMSQNTEQIQYQKILNIIENIACLVEMTGKDHMPPMENIPI